MLSHGLACSAPAQPADPAPAVGVSDFAAPSPPAEKGAASRLLAQVQKFYDGTTDFESAFKQTYVHPVYGTKTVSEGKLRVKKPGKMVWDYAADDTPDFWIDGTTVRAVERDTKQVVKKDLDTSDFAGAGKFLFGGRQLLDDFQVRLAGETFVKRYGQAGHSVVQMRPLKKNPYYKHLLLVIDDATGRVDAFVVFNGDESTNHFVLSSTSRNAGLGDDAFDFVKPKGFSEIDG
jgi:outer membrane lipoprotein carrier protein